MCWRGRDSSRGPGFPERQKPRPLPLRSFPADGTKICNHPVCQTLLLSLRSSPGDKSKTAGLRQYFQEIALSPTPGVRLVIPQAQLHVWHPGTEACSRPRVEEGGVSCVLGPWTHRERGRPADPDPGCLPPPSLLPSLPPQCGH